MNANVKMSGFPTWVLQVAVLQNDCGKEQMMIYYSVLFFFSTGPLYFISKGANDVSFSHENLKKFPPTFAWKLNPF